MDDVGDADGTGRTRRFLASDPAGDQLWGSAERVSDDDDGWRASTVKARLVVAAVALLVVGVLIGRLTAPDSDAGVVTGVEEDPEADSAAFAFPAGDQSREPFWGLVGYKRLAVDTFDRADTLDGLGQTGTGESWETPSGEWGIEERVARLFVSDPMLPSIAIVPASEGNGLFEVTMAVPERDAGLVFRYQDPSNYWAVTTNPSLGSWTVTRTVDGEQEAVGELNAPVKGGTTITVVITDTRMRFLVDSVEALSLDDSTFAGVRRAGLIAPANSSLEARWERFLTMEQPPAPE